ncbi:MAG: tRNA (N(6)-L-threonylcarbamoyladenosine(37)-C(2))-methylthiotransferase MtaB [Clostridiales bacterium]|jgi:threonylcarbamoyladenosine tRNA methylthiotransferase MtaB|nr:tRNA (N(6)-L-threonylcarbamoyladenosine(37)-C(2))-methylthiotransferase MtaB [Clostridiales bacterium]
MNYRLEDVMKIAFYTLGCKVNQYETQALKEKFLKRGYELVEEDEYADIYVVNTCTVTALADRKSRQYIRRMKKINPDSITAVIGCYAQVNPDEASSIEGVNIVVGTNEKNNLPDYIEDYIKQNRQITNVLDYDELNIYDESGSITSMDSRTRAYIKVQEGCNQFCSYCIIPYARGNVRSRSKEDILKEANHLISKGFRELVITGINTALYGIEDKHLGIEDIIKDLNGIPADFRIRLGSLEPTVINASYVSKLLQYEKLCPHLHLSLQSGSDRILKKMNRNYDSKGYKEIIKVLRDHDKCYGITTDIIVGFPGETEEDFQASIKIVEESGFNKVHVFQYSKRQGTKAAEMKDQIPSDIKKRRSAELIRVAEITSEKMIKTNLGEKRKVLFEEYDEATGLISGFSDNYIKVYCKVKEDLANELLNQFAVVSFMEKYKEGVLGSV